MAMAPAPLGGHLTLVLHAHLPYVRHPEHEEFLEEDWLYEAITETYLPLLAMMEGWRRERVPGRLTMSLTPPLCEMLRNELLVERYSRRLAKLLDLAEREVRRTRGDERFEGTARMYRDQLAEVAELWHRRWDRDLVGAFGRMQDEGLLEIITCSATHAFLPLLAVEPEYARAQVRAGVKSYRHHFGVNPPGIWLPECGYMTGLDQLLADEGLVYFIVDTHAVAYADPPPALGSMAPIVCPSGVLAFPRDPESSKQVWSAEEGYPGDFRYREFYRDIGWDLEESYLAGLLQATGDRKNLGIKYHRITGVNVALRDKAPYVRAEALEAADEHAAHFVESRAQQIEQYSRLLGRPVTVVAPYDAELFGHWWFEGPEFLDRVVRRAVGRDDLSLSTPSDVIRSGERFQVAKPAPSSWGDKGYGEVWCNGKNDWIWPHVHRAAAEMARLATARSEAEGLERRALNQLARELLLASASDWPFIITMGTMVPYAERRVREHINRFNWLLEAIEGERLDPAWLAELEAQDDIFPELDFRDFART